MKKILAFLLAVLMLAGCAFAGLAQGAPTNLLVGKEVTITWMAYEHPSQPFDKNAPVLDWIYERTGIRIELMTVPSSDYGTKVGALLATNSFPDVVAKATNVGAQRYYAEELFVDFLAQPEWIPNILKLMETADDLGSLVLDGKMYGFTSYPYYKNAAGALPMIRQDIVAQTGLPMPTTFDELYEVLLKMKELYPDSYPWGNRSGAGQLLKGAAYGLGSGFPWAGGAACYYDSDRDQWVYGQTDERFITALAFLQKCYKAGLIDPEYTAGNAQWQEKESTGKNFFMYDNATFALNFNLALEQTDPQAKFVPLAPLQNSFGQARGLLFQFHEGAGWFVRADSENAEAAVRLIDWLFSDEGRLVTNFGIEGQQYQLVDGVPTLLPEIVEAAAQYSDPWRGFMGEYGLGSLGMGTYLDERNQWPFMTDEAKAWFAAWQEMPGLEKTLPIPAFTNEEQEELADLVTYVNTIYAREIDKYITGAEPAENWANVQKEMLEANAGRIQEIYNAAYDRSR